MQRKGPLPLFLGCLLSACGADDSRQEDAAKFPQKHYDVLVVTLDTTRPDRLGCYGNPRIHTPVLDALAKESTVFDLAFTPVPSTLPSHCTIFTGLYPEQHGVHDNGCYALPRERRTLAEVLEGHGWKTAAFVAAFVLDRQFQLDQGFDVYDDQMSAPLSQLDPERLPRALPEGQRRWMAQLASDYQRPAEDVTDRARLWLATELEEGPFFLWTHYFDAHAPYAAPAEFETRYDPNYDGVMDGRAETFLAEMSRRQRDGNAPFSRQTMARDVEHMIARYDGELAYLDAQLGRLFDDLRQRGRWENTLVVVVGDHGESFGEHQQIWEHNGEVFDEVVRVPLLIRLPGGAPSVARSDALVRTLDLMPTVLEVLGITDGPPMEGHSLLDLTQDGNATGPGAVFLQAMRHEQVHPAPRSTLAFRDARSKLLISLDADDEVRGTQRFDLSRDPGERKSQRPRGAPGGPQSTEAQTTEARNIVQEYRQLPGQPSERPLRPLGQLQSEALKNLGYLDDDEAAEGEDERSPD